MTVKLVEEGSSLYVDAYGRKRKVERGFESMNGFYWFLIERSEDVYETRGGEEYGYYYPEGKGGKPKLPKNKDDKWIDTKWFCFVQMQEEELGYCSERELLESKPLVWEIPKKALYYSGRRSRR